MQKSMFLNKKKLDTAHHLLKLGTGVIKGVVTARKNIKHSNFYAFLRITNFEIVWKIHKCAS